MQLRYLIQIRKKQMIIIHICNQRNQLIKYKFKKIQIKWNMRKI